MALARKCDRCGKLYEYYESDDETNAVALFGVYEDGGIFNEEEPRDLCPECLRAFDAFMNLLKQEVKDNG